MEARLVLAMFASYRLSRMLAMEDGPFDVFSRIRGKIDPEQDTWLGRGINCPLCIGFWISLIVATVFIPFTGLDLMFNWLVIAGGQTFLQKMEL